MVNDEQHPPGPEAGESAPETHAKPTDPPETLYVDKTTVACDGGEGPLGHPRVYLRMDDTGRVECNYCDRLFILKDGAEDGSGD